MNIGTNLAIAVLSGMMLFAGCQSGESPSTAAPGDNTREPGPSNGQSKEIDGAAAQPVKPDATTLQQFLAREIKTTPHVHGAEADPGPATPLAKTAGLQACTIDYNLPLIINTLPNKAWDTFAWSPHYNITCAGAFWIYTYPLNQNHHHLMYEDPMVCYSLSLPVKMGRYAYRPTRIPGKCAEWTNPACNYNNVDPATLPRSLSPHTGSDIDQVYVIDKNTRARRVFNLKSLDIKPNSYAVDGCYPDAGHLQLWFKVAATQQWMYWAQINAGQTFYPGNWGLGWDEMRLTSPKPPYGWGVDNIKLDVVY